MPIAQTVFTSPFGVPFFAMIGVFLLSAAYPMQRSRPLSRTIALSSVLIAPLWAAYEQMLPADMNIRVDMLILIPIAIASLLLLGLRLPWILQRREGGMPAKEIGRVFQAETRFRR
jgi:hypothetical protein